MDRPSPQSPPSRPPAALTPGLRRLLWLIAPLAGLLLINSLYLLAISIAEALSGKILQNALYLDMFLLHLGLGLALMVLMLTFGALHYRRACQRPNRYAIRAGIALYLALILLFGSGILLTRFGFFEVNDPVVRRIAYWLHLIAPLAASWLFVLHRLAGPALRWRPLVGWLSAAAGISLLGLLLHLLLASFAPATIRAFPPALVETPSAESQRPAVIPAAHLMQDRVCAECHPDIAEQHAGSMHRLSSFNNPAYRKVIQDTRAELLARDGDLAATRLCAVCHDPVPLFSGRFDDPGWDPDGDPSAIAGITCLSCHAIVAVDRPLGNGAYRLSDPPRYPFAFSENPVLKWINRQLIKAKPAFHKQTLLKPVHRSAELCSACHKVHLPTELNHYRWLRGQNHYDSFRLSGVSGHRVDSFYYPPEAEPGCNGCHMPARRSTDPAARPIREHRGLAVHDHLFAAANTAVAKMVGRPAAENAARIGMMQRAARVDLFGLKGGDQTDGKLIAPLRPTRPAVAPGQTYLLEVVVRTDGIGHALTQGTADSNEVWLEVKVSLEASDAEAAEPAGLGRIIGHSGARAADGSVDDWAWFGNAYLLDRQGHRISQRNAQDIFVALYDHQIPPGAASVVHYRLQVPPDAAGVLRLEARLNYRKFDTRFYRYLLGDAFTGNDLPITTLAQDQLWLPIGRAGHNTAPTDPVSQATQTDPADPIAAIPAWQRWNDYGIGLLRQGKRGESRRAEAAFAQVEALGGAPGPLNLARVLHREGRLEEAAAALARAQQGNLPHGEAPPWTIAWYSALIARDLGDLDSAIKALEALASTRFSEARARGFDFAGDDRMLVELGRTHYERARRERSPNRQQARDNALRQARDRLEQALKLDPESAAAHHNLSLVLTELGEPALASRHRQLHERYRADDNAVERAVSLHRRRNPAADHAAEPVAVYPLSRARLSPSAPGDAASHTAAKQGPS